MTPTTDWRKGEQRLVVYDRDGAETFYATAYDNDHAAEVIADCEARYGNACKPRQIYSKDRRPTDPV